MKYKKKILFLRGITSFSSVVLLLVREFAVQRGPTVPFLLVAFTIATMVIDKFVRITYENIHAKNIIAPRIPLRGIFSVKKKKKYTLIAIINRQWIKSHYR